MNTIQNKGILWKLLQENGYFNDIKNEHFTEIQHNFESTINNISNSHTSIPLVEKNKKVISNMVIYLKKYKNNKNQMELPPQPTQIVFKKKDGINENLEKKKEEFLDLITPPEPNEIDFKDNQDQAVEGEINNLLEKAIQERENDLSFFPLEKKEGELGNENIIIEHQPKKDSLTLLNEKLDIIIGNQNEILKLIKK